MKRIVCFAAVSLVMAIAVDARPPRPSPKIDTNVYAKPATDTRKVTIKPPVSKNIVSPSPFLTAQADPQKKLVRKTTPTRFEKVPKYTRKRSHFTEGP